MSRDYYDVVVAGGGPAGIAAGIAASRTGARTLLIEKQGFVGGVAASGIPFINFLDQNRVQVIGGIAEELVNNLKDVQASLGHLIPEAGHLHSLTLIDPEWVKIVAEEMLLLADVELLYHSFVYGAKVKDNCLTSLQVANKSGRQVISAGCFVDATGDGDLAAFAGAEYEKGRTSDGLTQPMSLVFRLLNVNVESLGAIWIDAPLKTVPLNRQSAINVHLAGQLSTWDDLLQKMDLFPHQGHHIWAGTLRDRELTYVNTIRVAGLDATDPKQLSQAEIEGRRQLKILLGFLRAQVPGMQNSYLGSIAPQIGIRETRRITGEYVLTAEDVLIGRRFPDAIAKNGYCIDIHDPQGKGWGVEFVRDRDGTYDIPYRCLVPITLDGVVVSGRCISATHEALGSTRIMPCCMALGQAAGTAAALSVAARVAPRHLDVQRLRSALKEAKAIV